LSTTAAVSSLAGIAKIVMVFRKFAFAAAAALLVRPMTASFAMEKMEAAVSRSDPNAGSNPSAPELVIQGQHLYEHNCSHCHGPNMVNPGTIAFDLRKFPHDDKDRFVDSVTNGKNGRMPSWGDLLTTADIDKLWAYISSYRQP
jgi:cytochrome c55X